jgi:hypothetical protein
MSVLKRVSELFLQVFTEACSRLTYELALLDAEVQLARRAYLAVKFA